MGTEMAISLARCRAASSTDSTETSRMSPGFRTLPLGLRRLVVGRQRRALAEEVLLRLVEKDLVRLLASPGEPVLVHDHLEMLQPHLPRLLRDAVVDPLPQLVGERLVFQAGQLALELDALHHSRHLHLLPECVSPGPARGSPRGADEQAGACMVPSRPCRRPWISSSCG